MKILVRYATALVIAFFLTSGSGSGSEIYDLYWTDTQNRGTIPFAVNWPIEPVTTQTLNVPSEVSLVTALATSGAIINVAAGSYGNLDIFQNDQHWIIDNGATFSGMAVTSDRIIVEGGNVGSGSGFASVYSGTDVLIKNVNFDVTGMGTGLGESAGTVMSERVAWIQNTISSTDYTMYIAAGGRGSDAGDSGTHNDIIMAGNDMVGGTGSVQSSTRVMAVTRGIFVDNRSGNQAGNWVWRFHHGSGPFWFRRNMIDEGQFGMNLYADSEQGEADPFDITGDFWIYDSEYYISTPGPYSQRSSGGEDLDTYWGVLTVQGNAGYGGWGWYFNALPKDNISGNTNNAFQSPPALGDWLVAGGVPPGADH